MRQIAVFGLLTLGLAFGAGCSETKQEVAKPVAVTPAQMQSYPKEIQDAIKGKYPVKGMTEEQLKLALGETPCIKTRQSNGKTFQRWSYFLEKGEYKVVEPSRCFDTKYSGYNVFLEDGRVTHWDY